MCTHHKFMLDAIEQSRTGMKNNEGGPFGAVIVKDGKIVGTGNNQVTSSNDPTAHAEVTAIRDACKNLNSFQLDGCIMYTSCEPCPMCLGAIYWARPDKVFYANTREDAANIGFDDDFIYTEINVEMSERKIPFEQISRDEALKVFNEWAQKSDKTEY
ncbi:MAG: nucleoside deaminase [Flavobacteriaceae bacterium]|nr:nucleoside deaminase [Flavobacteriaceae bacterium]